MLPLILMRVHDASSYSLWQALIWSWRALALVGHGKTQSAEAIPVLSEANLDHFGVPSHAS